MFGTDWWLANATLIFEYKMYCWIRYLGIHVLKMEFVCRYIGIDSKSDSYTQWRGELANLFCDWSFYRSQQGLWHIMWQVSGILHKCHIAGVVNSRGPCIFGKAFMMVTIVFHVDESSTIVCEFTLCQCCCYMSSDTTDV